MSLIQLKKLTNDTRRSFRFPALFSTSYGGNRAVATVDDVNTLIDALNGLGANSTVDFTYRIVETGGVPSLALNLMTGSAGLCTCASCTGKENPSCKGCPIEQVGISNYKCADSKASMERTAPGVYQLDLDPDFEYNEVIVTFGNVSTLGVIVNVEKVSDILYTVTAFNTQTGAAEDQTLTNTPLIIKFWQ